MSIVASVGFDQSIYSTSHTLNDLLFESNVQYVCVSFFRIYHFYIRISLFVFVIKLKLQTYVHSTFQISSPFVCVHGFFAIIFRLTITITDCELLYDISYSSK